MRTARTATSPSRSTTPLRRRPQARLPGRAEDGASRSAGQDQHLERAAEIGFGAIAEGIKSIALATRFHGKYHHLLAALSRHGILKLPPELADYTIPAPRRGLTRLLREVEVTVQPGEWTLEVLYVQRTLPAGCPGLDFRAFAEHVATHDDPLSATFAEHLRRWALHPPAAAL